MFPSPCGVNIVANYPVWDLQELGVQDVSVPLRGKYRSEFLPVDRLVKATKVVSVPLRGKYRSEFAELLDRPVEVDYAVSVPLRGKYRSES